MQAVNLLPLEARPESRWTTIGAGLSPDRVITLGGVVITALALLLAGGYLYERSVVHDKKSTLTNDQARLAAVSARAQVVRDAQAQAAALTTTVNSIVAKRMVWDATLSDLARVLPDGVGLTTLQANALSAAPVAPPTTSTPSTSATTSTPTAPVTPSAATTTFTVSGTAPSHLRVALVLDRLALLPWLTGITLQSTSRTSTGSVTFNASSEVAGTGGH